MEILSLSLMSVTFARSYEHCMWICHKNVFGGSCGPVHRKYKCATTSDNWSLEQVSLAVWSEGRRHTGHWRDEKFHLVSLGQVGDFTSNRRKREGGRKKKGGKELVAVFYLSHCLHVCLYGGLKSHAPQCTSVTPPSGSLLRLCSAAEALFLQRMRADLKHPELG